MPRLSPFVLALPALLAITPSRGAVTLSLESDWNYAQHYARQTTVSTSTFAFSDSVASTAQAGGESASEFAGSTSTAVFPPPGAISSEASLSSFFPDASEVGFAGPTPSTYYYRFRSRL